MCRSALYTKFRRFDQNCVTYVVVFVCLNVRQSNESGSVLNRNGRRLIRILKPRVHALQNLLSFDYVQKDTKSGSLLTCLL
jgi:hypothetical protein